MIAAGYSARYGRARHDRYRPDAPAEARRVIAGVTLIVSLVVAVGIYLGVFVIPSPMMG